MNKNLSGKFITFEGVEGVGKTTNVKYLEEYLTGKGFEVLVTREPGGTLVAEQIRKILLSKHDEFIPSLTEVLLFYAARVQHVTNVIIPALEVGKWVICDRFSDSSYAYQCGGRGFSTEKFFYYDKMILNGFKPDLTVLLDLTPELGLERVNGRGEVKDRFESEELAFFKKIHSAFLELYDLEPKRIKKVDASNSLSVVQASIKDVIDSFISSN